MPINLSLVFELAMAFSGRGITLASPMKLAWYFFKKFLWSQRSGAVVKTISRLSMLGVAIGMAALIIVISIMNGLNESIRKKLLAVEPHLVFTQAGLTSGADIARSETYLWLRSQSDVSAHIFETQDVIIRTTDGHFSGAVARGVDAESLNYTINESLKATAVTVEVSPGTVESAPDAATQKSDTSKLQTSLPAPADASAPSADPSQKKSAPLSIEKGEAILGFDLARGLGILEGDVITLISPESLLLPMGEVPRFARLTVKKLISSNISDVDSKLLFYSRAGGLEGLNNVSTRTGGIEARVSDPFDMNRWIEPAKAMGVNVSTWYDRNSALFHALKIEKIAIASVLSLSALIAAFSIVTVVTMLLEQKRRELGLLMALGLSGRATGILFFKIGLLMSFCGVFAGWLAGVVISLVVGRIKIPILPDIYYDQTIPSKFVPSFVIGVAVCALIVAVFSSWLPAWQVTRDLSPTDALKAQRRTRAKPS
jgi:lipoprotein-releasing system permease protein